MQAACPHPAVHAGAVRVIGARYRFLAGALGLACALLAPGARAARPFEDSMAQRTLPCTVCHGPQGRAAADGYYPRIAGKPEGYLFNQLRNFRDGRRHYGLMAAMVDPLSDAYLQEIARHFAGLELPYPPPQPPQVPPAVLQRGATLVRDGDPARGVPACMSCHGAALTGAWPNVPGLLGLPRDYLNSQLGAWKTGERRAQAPDCMADLLRRLPDDDLAAVTAWLAAQPLPADPRAVRQVPTRAAGPMTVACGSAPELGGRAP